MADAQANIYALIANGTHSTRRLMLTAFPISRTTAMGSSRFPLSGGTLQVADYFNMSADVDKRIRRRHRPRLRRRDGAARLDIRHRRHTPALAVGAGKDGNIYVVNRNNMGKFSTTQNNVYQEVAGGCAEWRWSNT